MTLRDRWNAFLHPEEIKINPAYSGVIQYSDTPKPVQMPRNYKTYAKEGYRGNDTIYKCISYIARNGAAIPPVLYKDKTMKKRIDKHELLAKLERPNNEQDGVAHRESVLSYKLLAGNAYIYSIRKDKRSKPDELWSMRPDWIEVIPAPKRGIVGYQYEHFEQPIAPENVGHLKYWHPDDTHYGLSPLEVAAIIADQQKAIKLWNLALMQNNARPPGAWTVPVALSKNDRERLEAKLKEKLQGYKNAGTPPVLDAGLKWESIAHTPESLDYLEGLQYNAALIANVFNIAPQLVGDQAASTFNNMDAAKVASYTEAIFPELDSYYALLNAWLVPMYPDLANSGAYLYYDKESVEVVQRVLQEQKNAKQQRAVAVWTGSLATMNEARELAGLPPLPDGNVFRFGNVLVPVDKLEEYAEQSLTEPAAPPVAIAEPVAQNAPPATPPSAQSGQDDKTSGQQNEEKPTNDKPANRAPAKSYEAVSTGQLPTLQEALSILRNNSLSSGISKPDEIAELDDFRRWRRRIDDATT